MTPNGKTPRKGDEYLSNRCDNLSLGFLPRGPEFFCSVLFIKNSYEITVKALLMLLFDKCATSSDTKNNTKNREKKNQICLKKYAQELIDEDIYLACPGRSLI